MNWRTIDAEGQSWEVRAVSTEAGQEENGEDMLEFRSRDGNLPPRRVTVPAGQLADMDDRALAAAFARARPLGGDFYGRPGKHMTDAR